MYSIDSFTIIKNYNNIDDIIVITILEFSIKKMIIENYQNVENIDIFIDYEYGYIDIWRNRIAVYKLHNLNKEIEILSALQIESDFKLGENITEQFTIKFINREDILTFKYNFYLKSKEYYNIYIYNKFKIKIGHILYGQIFLFKEKKIIRDFHQNDMILPKTEQMFNDFMRNSEAIRTIVKTVYWKENQPIIMLSRILPIFIKNLFEQEISEILDGFIIIKQVVRIPGEKSKISVKSSDFQTDPVVTCLGVKGFRILSIVRELKTENIDVIKFTNNLKIYILRALAPTKISIISIIKQNKIAMISLKNEQLFNVIGRKGINIRLAKKLTNYKLNILRSIYNKYYIYEEELIYFYNKIFS